MKKLATSIENVITKNYPYLTSQQYYVEVPVFIIRKKKYKSPFVSWLLNTDIMQYVSMVFQLDKGCIYTCPLGIKSIHLLLGIIQIIGFIVYDTYCTRKIRLQINLSRRMKLIFTIFNSKRSMCRCQLFHELCSLCYTACLIINGVYVTILILLEIGREFKQNICSSTSVFQVEISENNEMKIT